jgi:ferredoxin
MRIVVDRERCVGSGQCVRAESRVFDQDEDDGRVVLLVAQWTPDAAQSVRRAVQLCPTQALSLTDAPEPAL